MGWFYKTLDDAEDAIKKNNRKEALNIVEKHLSVDYHFESTIPKIEKCLEEYRMYIDMLKARLSPKAEYPYDKLSYKQTAEGRPEKEFLDTINGAKNALKKLNKLMMEALADELKLK